MTVVATQEVVERVEAVQVVERAEYEHGLRTRNRTPLLGKWLRQLRAVDAGAAAQDHLRQTGGATAADAVRLRRGDIGKCILDAPGGGVDPRDVVLAEVHFAVDDFS